MSIMINDAHILYYHRVAVRAALLGHSHFSICDYLTVMTWIWAMFLFLDVVALTRLFVGIYENVFLGLVW